MISLNLRHVLRMTTASTAMLAALLAAAPSHADETHLDDTARLPAAARFPAVAVGPQYDTTHVCVAPEDFDRFTDSFVATFGGKKSKQGVFQVTPTPSQTMSQLVLTPVGTISVFGFKTPIPYPFCEERTGYLVTDMDMAVKSARSHGADVVVATFPDPIGRDAIIRWPGGVNMQLYWHTQAPNYDPLQTVPENRVYVSPERAGKLAHDFAAFSHGKIVSDVRKAPGIEIGRPNDTYRRIRIESGFGKMTVLATDGHLPFPFGREMTGYEVADLATTLKQAEAAGVTVLVPPFTSDGRDAALVQFPGGYVAEIHARSK
ncbi:glyoxalase [Burkholderia contaminans]|uniref:Lactoylglutathione lyase n=1 Tax=Burkholderia contaminans TaxID=488447 RepID=A0A6P2VDN1_9BURK|nr:glyoxalase [Burkholderia contaminans]VWC79778.1 lactoylglutathione lyase [Burkholderia contaminans]